MEWDFGRDVARHGRVGKRFPSNTISGYFGFVGHASCEGGGTGLRSFRHIESANACPNAHDSSGMDVGHIPHGHWLSIAKLLKDLDSSYMAGHFGNGGWVQALKCSVLMKVTAQQKLRWWICQRQVSVGNRRKRGPEKNYPSDPARDSVYRFLCQQSAPIFLTGLPLCRPQQH